jgi:tetratricopeptide (TPR) repeat protein
MASTNLGNLAATQGDLIACREYYLRALSITREIGERPKEGVVLGNLGWITGTLGDYATAQAYCEQNLKILRQVGDQRGEALTLINLSAYAGRQGNDSAALAYAEPALHLAGLVGDPSAEAWALTYLGHARLGLGLDAPARAAYQAALAIRRRLNQPALAAEPLAGLARADLAGGAPQHALDYVNEIISFIDEGGSLGSADEPLRIYLTGYQVLKANQDARARRILEAGYRLLHAQAEQISDETLRKNFLEAVPYHREISAAWAFAADSLPAVQPDRGIDQVQSQGDFSTEI